MQFNLLETGYVTTSGTVSFDIESIDQILSVSGTVTISGSNNDNFWIDGDIVDRVGVYQIRYYFDSITSSGTVASGINFYYKNDVIGSYSSLITNIGPGYYYTTVPSLSAPRYIKLNHSVVGTAIYGTVVGLEVLNDDSVIDFGAGGNLTSDTTLTSLSYLNYNDYIKEIEIYNSGSSVATAHVFMDPQYNDSDELLSISASESGPWVFARNIDYVISNANNWAAGQYNNTNTSAIPDGKLRLDVGETVGTYITPIFKNESVKFAYIDMLQTVISGAIVAVDIEDYTSTIQIRSSNTKPLDYSVYRTIILPGYPNSGFSYKEYSMTTDTEVYDSLVETGVRIADDYGVFYNLYDYKIIVDYDTNKSAFFLSYRRTGGSYDTHYRVTIWFTDGDGEEYARSSDLAFSSTYEEPLNAFLKEIIFDTNLGVWVYFYMESSGYAGYPATDTGYYLMHINYTGGYPSYNSGTYTSDLILSYDVVYGSDAIWCINGEGTNSIIKLSTNGTVLVSYDTDILDPKYLCSTNDGGFWLVDDDVLYKFNSTPTVERTLTTEINDELILVKLDPADSDSLWIIDGAYLKRISSVDGRIFSSVYLEDLIVYRVEATTEGIALFCKEPISGDYSVKFVGRASGGVNKTINDNTGLKFISYDNPVIGDVIPLSDDPVWNSGLAWNKAVTDNAVLPREEYNQLKLTLRRPITTIDSPTVENIYYQDNVEIVDIYPGQSKTLYLRISLPEGISIGGNYESLLRVWWELPVI